MLSGRPHICLQCLAALLLLPLSICLAGDGGDSLRVAGCRGVNQDSLRLVSQTDEYLEAIGRLPIPRACAELDFMLGSVQSDSIRNMVATRAYRFFRASKVMGSENVSVYIYDKWFATFKAVFPDIDELDDAEFYAFVNRQSLIGCKAPELTVNTLDGEEITLPSKGRISIIYFYSTECPKCLYTSLKLKEYLNSHSVDLDLFTVYTGSELQRAQEYTVRELNVSNTCKTMVYHTDGGDTDYPVKYGVVQTPRLFLVLGDGTVVGRNLDVDALSALLESIVDNCVEKFS